MLEVAWAHSKGRKQVSPAVGPLCPPFLQVLEPSQRCGSVSQTKPLPIKPGRTSQSQSATGLGSPSQASWQEGCQGSRSDKRILNHIYMCVVQKGKRRGEKPLQIRNPKRKSLTNLPKKKKNQPQICLRCSQIAVLKSSAFPSSSSFHPSNLPKKVSNFALICALVARTKQNVTAAFPQPLPRPLNSCASSMA